MTKAPPDKKGLSIWEVLFGIMGIIVFIGFMILGIIFKSAIICPWRDTIFGSILEILFYSIITTC